jgi:hypothetical protein
LCEPNFLAYDAFLARRRWSGEVTEVFDFREMTSARTCRTASLKQIARIGCLEFLRMSTICRAEVSR